jgi:hypothetical protein
MKLVVAELDGVVLHAFYSDEFFQLFVVGEPNIRELAVIAMIKEAESTEASIGVLYYFAFIQVVYDDVLPPADDDYS